MLIKKSQSSVWFTLGSENETMFCDNLELLSARLPVKVLKTLNDRPSHILSTFHLTVLLDSLV